MMQRDRALRRATSTRVPASDAALRGTAVSLLRPRSPVALSLAEVRETGLPALLLDFGEALLYLDEEIFEVDTRLAPPRVGSPPAPLPAEILANGVGIDYGWRHAGRCACRFCSEGRTTRSSASTGRVG